MGFFDRLKIDPVYNTRAVVQRTGVPADTFRAWERRYGLPMPSRTAGNQRLYSERDLAIISWLRDQTRDGLTISQAVALFRSEDNDSPASITREGVSPSSDPEAQARSSQNGARRDRLAAYRDEVIEALVAFDAARADRAVEEALALLPLEDVCLNVLEAALVEIGERWLRGEVSISSEHYASHFVMRKIGTLFNLSRPEVGRGPLLAACVEGELHEVGLLLTCLFLSRRGYRIVYLGANLPIDDLVEATKRTKPALVLLSASTHQGAEHLIAASRLLNDCAPAPSAEMAASQGHRRPLLGYGGRVFLVDAALREHVKGVFLGRDADEAVATVHQVLAHSAT